MNYLFFDTETTGLPHNFKAPMSKLDNWPRVIQLAWILTNSNGKELNRGKYLIKPDGWKVPTGRFWVDNNFSQSDSETNGIPISEALDLFCEDLAQTEYVISHNMAFDRNVLGAEIIRAGSKSSKVRRICTKELSTPICKLPNWKGYKWPKLSELYSFLFNKGFDDAHDALADVIACKECFFEMLRRGFLNIETNNEAACV